MRFVWISLFSLLTGYTVAADVTGSQDHADLPRYTGAQISQYHAHDKLDQRYPLGSLRRLGGQLRSERELIASGPAVTIIYALPNGEDHRAAFSHSRETLRKNGFDLLFWCEGRECGSSALWANNVFNSAALNGGDDQQAFALLRREDAEQDQLLALYAVTRGNRRAYLLAEQMQVADLGEQLPVAATLLRLLRAEESLNLPTLDAAQGRWLNLLAQTLSQDITLRVLLAGEGAADWKAALIASGIRASRLDAEEILGQPLVISRVR